MITQVKYENWRGLLEESVEESQVVLEYITFDKYKSMMEKMMMFKKELDKEKFTEKKSV